MNICMKNVELRVLISIVYWLLCAGVSVTSDVETLLRHRRNLLWPSGNTHKVQFIFGFGLPSSDLEDMSITLGTVIKFSFGVPTNISELGPIPFTKREIRTEYTRRNMYNILEIVGTSLGFDGKACLLRNICDLAAAPLHHNGILGELFHIVFTPSTTSNDVNEYLGAERWGNGGGEVCKRLYPECTAGLLDLVTRMYLTQ